jgi:hypothetical protein
LDVATQRAHDQHSFFCCREPTQRLDIVIALASEMKEAIINYFVECQRLLLIFHRNSNSSSNSDDASGGIPNDIIQLINDYLIILPSDSDVAGLVDLFQS